jgi:5'-methylthioadenosine phosphorylase
MVCIEGPRFSSRAESLMYRLWGGTVIGMTAVPEVCLAAERALCYASIAMPTDYDSWRGDGHESVNVDLVMKTFAHNNVMAINLIRAVIPKLAAIDWTDTLRANRVKHLYINQVVTQDLLSGGRASLKHEQIENIKLEHNVVQ